MIQNLYEKYKNLNLLRRLMIVFLVAGGGAGYKFLTDFEALELDGQEKKKNLIEIEKKLSQVLLESKRIPKMRQSLIKAEILFEESKNRLPDQFFIDRTLQTISTLAKDAGLNLKLYDPGTPQKEEGSYTFISLPISLVLTGKFKGVIEFMERVLNLDQLLEIRSYKLELTFPPKEKSKTGKSLTEEELQQQKRENSEILFEAELFAFRSLSEQEFKKITGSGAKTNKRRSRRSQ